MAGELEQLGILYLEKLENNPNEWGKHMDIQAAAIFYDVDIDVAMKTRTTQVYVEQVHSYN